MSGRISVCTWTMLNLWWRSKLFNTKWCIQNTLRGYKSAIGTSSAFLVTQCRNGKKTSCLWKPHCDTLRCPTPLAPWAEADRQLMTPDDSSLQTASWISHHLLLTCALIQSLPASTASWGPGRLCKLRDNRPNGKDAEWACFSQSRAAQLWLMVALCCWHTGQVAL